MTPDTENLIAQGVLYAMGVTCKPDVEPMFSTFLTFWKGQTVDDSEACRERFSEYLDGVMAAARSETKPLISELVKALQRDPGV